MRPDANPISNPIRFAESRARRRYGRYGYFPKLKHSDTPIPMNRYHHRIVDWDEQVIFHFELLIRDMDAVEPLFYPWRRLLTGTEFELLARMDFPFRIPYDEVKQMIEVAEYYNIPLSRIDQIRIACMLDK